MVRRDTNRRRYYTEADVEAIKVSLADLERRDQEVLDSEGVYTRAQAMTILGVRKTSMRKFVASGALVPREILLPSKGGRKVQVFGRAEVEALRAWLDEGGRVSVH